MTTDDDRTATGQIITTHADDNRVTAEVDARLTALVASVAGRRGIHHVNLAVASGDGSRRWAAAAGPTEPDSGPVRPETPFFIASVTKRFIITLVLQAHERGELDLDSSITAYLPDDVTDGLHVLGGVDRTSEITVRHLASHTAGLPDFFEKPRSGGPSLFERLRAGEDFSWDFDDVVRMARDEHRPHFTPQDLTAPKQKARYSDTGFQLLIRIVETVGGGGFGELLTERICRPVGLSHTWLPGRSRPLSPAGEPSALYSKERRFDLPKMIESSNDLISTTGDLLTFNRALLAGGLFGDPDMVELLTERRNRLRNIFTIRYGLGTMIFKIARPLAPGRRPATLVGHSGATGTWLFHCPELDVHLAGTVDQTKGEATPFRLMVKVLRAFER
jgi:D-alanyl-D-alanine carboxypeptidase